MRTLIFLLSIYISSYTFASSGNYDFFKGQKTGIKNPFKLRDPFKRNIKIPKKKVGKYKGDNNTYSNAATIEGVPLNRIKIVGVLLGNNRRAMVKIDGSDDIVMLKEGMVIGNNQAELKAILPGGIVLVEKIRNVYDQDEYLETILPVSEE